MKLLLLLMFPIITLAQNQKLDSEKLFLQSVKYHDPHEEWNQTRIKLHIQEPRTGNPKRYSIVEIDVPGERFFIERDREGRVTHYQLDSAGSFSFSVDGSSQVEASFLEKYGVNHETTQLYKGFYEVMYGLPMSLSSGIKEFVKAPDNVLFGEIKCYKIQIELLEPLFSAHWNLFLNQENYRLEGIEIFYPEDDGKGERLYFNGKVKWGKGLSVPRFRHWHEYKDDQYSGSDIIVTVQEDH